MSTPMSRRRRKFKAEAWKVFIQTFLFSPSANLNNVLCLWKIDFKIAPLLRGRARRQAVEEDIKWKIMPWKKCWELLHENPLEHETTKSRKLKSDEFPVLVSLTHSNFFFVGNETLQLSEERGVGKIRFLLDDKKSANSNAFERATAMSNVFANPLIRI